MLTQRIRAGLVKLARAGARRFGVELTRYSPPDSFDDRSFLAYCRDNLAKSKSQSFQDLFVQYALDDRGGGFFVEFGATDGVDLSNSWMLEHHFHWTGILAEPARCWRDSLRSNRNCIVDPRCVWDTSGEMLEFNEVEEAAFSTVHAYSNRDSHAGRRVAGTTYSVESVSLNDLLEQHAAPRHIDYLSLDTEGSEWRILAAFDFRRYQVDVITVEHNYTADRDRIHSLLKEKGFIRKFEIYSLHDDWYVREDLTRHTA